MGQDAKAHILGSIMRSYPAILTLCLGLAFSMGPGHAQNPASAPPSEASSGFASRVQTPTPIPTASPHVDAAPPSVPKEAPRVSPAAPAVLQLTDKDLIEPTPLGPDSTPVPASPVKPMVKVDGTPIPPTGFAVLVDPMQEVALDLDLPAEDGSMQLPAPTTMDLGKPRTYEFFDDWRATWRMQSGALRQRTRSGVVWQCPAESDACRFSITVRRQSRIEDTSQTALQAPVQKTGVEGNWEATFIVRRAFDAKGDGIINGYPVGIYPNPEVDSAPGGVRENPSAYRPPTHLIPVTPETAKMQLTPHLRLGDFSPAEDRDKFHVIALDPRLVKFLEALCVQLNKEELKGDGLKILRGYVSPYTRQRLVREGIDVVPYSRHQYGDAAVIIVDADGNGAMDDLTGDGMADVRDADRLADIVDALQRSMSLWGGVGTYARHDDPKAPSTPCVQLDLRGWRERWRRAE